MLARYSKGAQARKTASARTRTTTSKAAPAPRRARRTTTARPAGGKRGSSSLSDQVLALATGKTQQEIAAAVQRGSPERGHTHAVLVRDNAFEYEGERYRSLSVIAKRITGAHWSGPRFFGLTKPAGASAAAEAD